jgi:hypothetical protein
LYSSLNKNGNRDKDFDTEQKSRSLQDTCDAKKNDDLSEVAYVNMLLQKVHPPLFSCPT